MRLNEIIDKLMEIDKTHGNLDVVWDNYGELCNILSMELLLEPTKNIRWCWTGPIVLVTFFSEDPLDTNHV